MAGEIVGTTDMGEDRQIPGVIFEGGVHYAFNDGSPWRRLRNVRHA